MSRITRLAAMAKAALACVSALLLLLVPGLAAAQCDSVTVLEDASGDYSGDFANGGGLPEQDLLALEIAELGGDLIQFNLKVQPFAAPALPPNAVWYVSFETPDGPKYGVRLETDDSGAERMYSYAVAAGGLEDDGPSDGRFPEDAGQVPLEAGSGRSADGTITMIAKASSIGLSGARSGKTLGPFNSASIQGGNAVAVRFATPTDTMPDGLSRDGFYDFCGGKTGSVYGGASGSGVVVGGHLPLGTLAWLGLMAGLALARRR
jgi:hypothetical protein